MNEQCFAVSQIREVIDEFKIVDELETGRLIFKPERHHGAEADAIELFLCNGM